MRSFLAKSVGVTTPLQLKVGSGYGLYEAPPHITGLRLKLAMTGTRSVTYPYTGGPEGGTKTITETLDYFHEINLVREAWVPEDTEMYVDDYGYGLISGGTASPSAISSGTFLALTAPWTDRDYNDLAMFIGQQSVDLYCNAVSNGPCGTWEITHSAAPGLDSSGNLPGKFMPIPFFGFLDSDAGNHRLPFNRWFQQMGEAPSQWGSPIGTADSDGVDLTGWSIAQWRDKTGVIHGFTWTETDWTAFDPDNNSTSDVTMDYEWELS